MEDLGSNPCYIRQIILYTELKEKEPILGYIKIR